MIELVEQGKTRLCGQACVAMVSSRELGEICKLMNEYKGTKTQDIIAVLQKLKIDCGAKLQPISKNHPIPKLCIAKMTRFTRNRTRRPGWHWVVIFDKKVYDPNGYITSIKIAEHRHKGRVTSFIKIDRCRVCLSVYCKGACLDGACN